MSIRSLDVTAPYGTTIHATLTGVRFGYADESAPAFRQWLTDLVTQFDNQPAGGDEKRVPCPACGGRLAFDGDMPRLCVLCKNTLSVPESIANEYVTAMSFTPNAPRVATLNAPCNCPAFDLETTDIEDEERSDIDAYPTIPTFPPVSDGERDEAAEFIPELSVSLDACTGVSVGNCRGDEDCSPTLRPDAL